MIETAVTRFIDGLYPDLEDMAGVVNVREGIDFVETLSNFLNQNLVGMIRCVFETPSAEFSTALLPLAQRALAEFVATCRHCFSDDQASLERLLQNRLDLLCGDALPAVRQWTTTATIGHLRNYMASVDVPERVVTGYVVRNADGRQQQQMRRPLPQDESPESGSSVGARSEKRAKRDESTHSEDESFATPRSSPELMETGSPPAEAPPVTERSSPTPEKATSEEAATRPTNETPPEVRIPPNVPQDQLRFPSSLLSRSGMGPDMVVGSQPWHRALPADWVPIVARDAQVQQQQAKSGEESSGPFSDAYLSTQPAKRRKIVADEKPEGDVEKVISDSLQEAIATTGATPASSVARVVAETSGSSAVREAVQGEVVKTMKKRLQKDKDFNTHEGRFPNSKSFASKK